MSVFNLTTHLSEILEESNKHPVIIFKYSSRCAVSAQIKDDLERASAKQTLTFLVYIVTVQTEPVLSDKITEYFNIKHETPEIIIVNKGMVVYTAHHWNIKVENFVYQ